MTFENKRPTVRIRGAFKGRQLPQPYYLKGLPCPPSPRFHPLSSHPNPFLCPVLEV